MHARVSPLDLAFASALLAWGVLEAVLLDGPGGVAERLVWAVLATVPLVWRRRVPSAVGVWLALVVFARLAVAEGGGVQEEGAMPFPAVLLAVFTVMAAATVPVARAVAVAALLYASVFTVILTAYFTGDPEAADFAVLTFFVLAAAGAGFFVRRRVSGGELAARQAVLDERARIARELHDIIGHSVSAIALQAGAAEALLRRDPDAAAGHLEAVQRTARETMTEMRRLTGVLKEDDASYAPPPSLAALGTLVESARSAGMDVSVVEEGARGDLAPGVDLAAYRIVQEALTNARKHAGPVRASVRVVYGADAVAVEVANEAGPGGSGDSSGGQGLAGAAERARLFGGTLDAAAVEGGGFRVRARLPLEAAP